MKQLPKLVFGTGNGKVIVSELSSVSCNQSHFRKINIEVNLRFGRQIKGVRSCQFTADATVWKELRLDYAGGDDCSFFFLKNCGFFSDKVLFDRWFSRSGSGKAPEINFSQLP